MQSAGFTFTDQHAWFGTAAGTLIPGITLMLFSRWKAKWIDPGIRDEYAICGYEIGDHAADKYPECGNRLRRGRITVRRLPFAVCRLPSAISRQPSVVNHLATAILPSAFRGTLNCGNKIPSRITTIHLRVQRSFSITSYFCKIRTKLLRSRSSNGWDLGQPNGDDPGVIATLHTR